MDPSLTQLVLDQTTIFYCYSSLQLLRCARVCLYVRLVTSESTCADQLLNSALIVEWRRSLSLLALQAMLRDLTAFIAQRRWNTVKSALVPLVPLRLNLLELIAGLPIPRNADTALPLAGNMQNLFVSVPHLGLYQSLFTSVHRDGPMMPTAPA